MDIVIRSPERVRTEDGQTVCVVQEHNACIATQGKVALAKFGARVSEHSLKTIDDAIKNGTSPFLYLISKSNGIHQASKSQICATHVSLPIDLQSFVPSYYKFMEFSPTTWFIFDKQFQPSSIDNLVLASSGRSLLEVLSETRTASMMVKRK